jgi:hypothetical protein
MDDAILAWQPFCREIYHHIVVVKHQNQHVCEDHQLVYPAGHKFDAFMAHQIAYWLQHMPTQLQF